MANRPGPRPRAGRPGPEATSTRAAVRVGLNLGQSRLHRARERGMKQALDASSCTGATQELVPSYPGRRNLGRPGASGGPANPSIYQGSIIYLSSNDHMQFTAAARSGSGGFGLAA
jgi:hypothetical protein